MKSPDYQQHRITAGRLISHTPEEFYDVIGEPRIVKLGEAVMNHIWNTDYPEYDNQTLKAGSVLQQGVRDVAFMTYIALNASDARLHTIVRTSAPQFIEIVASVASLPQDEITTYYHVQARNATSGLTPAQFLQTPYSLVQIEHDDISDEDGCPFAKKNAVDKTPLFTAFTRWSTALAVAAYDNYPDNDNAETLSDFRRQFLLDNPYI